MKKYNITKKYLIQEYIDNKITITQIAKRIKCSYTFIRNHLLKYNIKIRTKRESMIGKNQKFNISKDFLIKEYIVNKKSAYKIAEMLKCTNGTIYNCLEKYNIKSRSHSEAVIGELCPSFIDGRTNKKYYCIDCGKELSGYQAKRCRSCCNSGENNPSYIDGLSREYPSEFNEELKESIRKRDNYTCQLCGKSGKCVHHIDYDKENCKEENLLTLCIGCNVKVNYNREYWKNYFSSVILVLV